MFQLEAPQSTSTKVWAAHLTPNNAMIRKHFCYLLLHSADNNVGLFELLQNFFFFFVACRFVDKHQRPPFQDIVDTLSKINWFSKDLNFTKQWGPCALHHWIQSSMEAICLATQQYPEIEWLGGKFPYTMTYAHGPHFVDFMFSLARLSILSWKLTSTLSW